MEHFNCGGEIVFRVNQEVTKSDLTATVAWMLFRGRKVTRNRVKEMAIRIVKIRGCDGFSRASELGRQHYGRALEHMAKFFPEMRSSPRHVKNISHPS